MEGTAGEVFGAFLRLGLTAFGGPAAHVALMEQEFVQRRRWLAREELLDLLAASQLIPGPNSTELAIHLGYRRAGWPGLLAAGAGFIGPAILLTGALAWAYTRFGALAGTAGALAGAKAVAFVVVLKALADFSRTALTTPTRWALALAALVANLLGGNELLVLGAAVVLGLALAQPRRGASAAAVAPAAPGLLAIFGLFAKIGAVLFGSGYVLLAFLHGDLVDRLHWLTDRQLLDAVAAGQLTPGPVFSTATFVGYLVAGTPGAAVATAGIFLPAFVFVALSGLVLPRLRTSPTFRRVLDAVIAASLGLIGAVTILLARAGLSSWPTGAIAAVAAIALWRAKLNPAWILVGGVVAGWVVAG